MVRTTNRTVRAFLFAPLIVPVVSCLPLPGKTLPSAISISTVIVGILILAVFTLPVAYCAELILGIPLWLIFKYFQIRSIVAFAAGGAVIGLFVYGVMEMYSPAFYEQRYLSIDIAGALASAILFRAIVFSGQPPDPAKQ
jgi:hypothetical protein